MLWLCHCDIVLTQTYCPNANYIDPCTCIENGINDVTIDCSLAQSEEEIELAFLVDFPINNLTSFLISNNLEITSLSSNLFTAKSFQQITIKYTNIELIDFSFFNACFGTLLKLEVSYNPLLTTFAFDSFDFFSSLTLVDLEHNGLSFLPQMSSDTIEVMILQYNLIDNITASAFSNCTELKEIYLNGNLLEEIPEGNWMMYIIPVHEYPNQ